MKPQLIATNKKAFRNFFLSQKFECGLELKGSEIKSIRAGHASFLDSFAKLQNGEVFLYNLHVSAYKEASYLNVEPTRVRKLLLNKREIRKIERLVTEKSMTLIPTKIYFNERGYAKVEIALGKGKKLYDKREDIKKRTIEKALKRTVKVRKR
jgi:SsrA-binding protein